ncbi:MAG: Asp23/Gls24 family envelope stress response protein [Clostridiales bacterium]|nr:Asp23/Gls24 family envelope stress response protein [Clostridiales bacterium]
MSKEILTPDGRIVITKEVVAKLAGIATTQCFGIIGMVSSRISDGISEILGKEALARGVDVVTKGEKFAIRVNVVVGFGTKIPMIANNVIENVKYTVERYTGLVVGNVEVCVRGVRVID